MNIFEISIFLAFFKQQQASFSFWTQDKANTSTQAYGTKLLRDLTERQTLQFPLVSIANKKTKVTFYSRCFSILSVLFKQNNSRLGDKYACEINRVYTRKNK
jgi:hypothetical protein